MFFVLSTRQILILDDVVYNQTMGPGATLDKRRPDLRDELGYIAPPNRKLPPVPGSNYNTCDRIKRGTVISKHLNFPKQHLLIPTTFSLFFFHHHFVTITILNCIYVATKKINKASKDLSKLLYNIPEKNPCLYKATITGFSLF